MYTYSYPRPGLTCDAAVFGFWNGGVRILLIERADDPYKGMWALPGGFVNEGETAEEAVARELNEETSLRVASLRQIFTATKPGRDPRGWTVSVIFAGFVRENNITVTAGDDARLAQWFDLGKLPALAFDHQEIIVKIKEYIKEKFLFFLPDREMLPEQFDPESLKMLINQFTDNVPQSEFLLNKWIGQGIVKIDRLSALYSFDVSVMDKISMTGFV